MQLYDAAHAAGVMPCFPLETLTMNFELTRVAAATSQLPRQPVIPLVVSRTARMRLATALDGQQFGREDAERLGYALPIATSHGEIVVAADRRASGSALRQVFQLARAAGVSRVHLAVMVGRETRSVEILLTAPSIATHLVLSARDVTTDDGDTLTMRDLAAVVPSPAFAITLTDDATAEALITLVSALRARIATVSFAN